MIYKYSLISSLNINTLLSLVNSLNTLLSLVKSLNTLLSLVNSLNTLLLSLKVQEARSGHDDEAVKKSINDYEDALAR